MEHEELCRIDLAVRIAIRDLVIDDLDAVGSFSSPSHVLSVRRAMDRADRGEARYFAAALPSNVVIGKACLDLATPRPPEITAAAVHGLWQNLGIGTALLKACEQEARRRACAELHIGVDDRDKRPMALYLRAGYEVVGEGPASWDETDPDGTTSRVTINEIFMTKQLT